jgi:hypothetical protein
MENRACITHIQIRERERERSKPLTEEKIRDGLI